MCGELLKLLQNHIRFHLPTGWWIHGQAKSMRQTRNLLYSSRRQTSKEYRMMKWTSNINWQNLLILGHIDELINFPEGYLYGCWICQYDAWFFPNGTRLWGLRKQKLINQYIRTQATITNTMTSQVICV
jgi:hypothetical protein